MARWCDVKGGLPSIARGMGPLRRALNQVIADRSTRPKMPSHLKTPPNTHLRRGGAGNIRKGRPDRPPNYVSDRFCPGRASRNRQAAERESPTDSIWTI